MPNDYTGIDIRPMRLDHLDEIMEIEPVAFGSHHWSHQSFVNELNNAMGNYYVAYESATKGSARPSTRTLIGYSGFWLIGDEAHITTLAVHPDYRRQHVGERLLINDILQAQKVGAIRITLEVRVSNESAQKLYYKYDFKSLGLRRNYYQDNDEDALVLWTENIHAPGFKQILQERMDALGDFTPSQFGFIYEPERQLQHGGTNGSNGKNGPHSNEFLPVPNVIYRGADEC